MSWIPALPVLTVQEPWAWLIVNLTEWWDPAKDVENRGERFPDFSGLLLIHSGKGERYALGPLATYAEVTGEAVRRVGQYIQQPSIEEIRGRGIIGAVDIAQTVPLGEVNCYPRWAKSPWAEGPKCLLIDRVYPFRHPIPCRGRQGIWYFPSELCESQLEAAIEREAIQHEGSRANETA